jgi:hypothetical protein
VNRFRTQLERHHLLWHWSLAFHHDDGRIEHIASGTNLRKSRAELAAQSWTRVWLRRRGLLT